MRTIKQVNIKNHQNYFFNDMTNIRDFDPSLLNVDSIKFSITPLFMTLNTSKI